MSKSLENDNYIFSMDDKGEKVSVFDKNKEKLAEISNSDDIYLMYLQNHPRFGLTVVASVRNQNGDWDDSYLAFRSGKFEIVSNAR